MYNILGDFQRLSGLCILLSSVPFLSSRFGFISSAMLLNFLYFLMTVLILFSCYLHSCMSLTSNCGSRVKILWNLPCVEPIFNFRKTCLFECFHIFYLLVLTKVMRVTLTLSILCDSLDSLRWLSVFFPSCCLCPFRPLSSQFHNSFEKSSNTVLYLGWSNHLFLLLQKYYCRLIGCQNAHCDIQFVLCIDYSRFVMCVFVTIYLNERE